MTSALNQYPELKELYERMNELGEGSFGKVYLAQKLTPPYIKSEVHSNQNMNQSNKEPQKSNEESFKPSKSSSQEMFMAIKKLKPYIRKKNISPSSMQIEHFPEISVMKALDHPNVMSIHQILQENKGYQLAHYLVLDLGVGIMELARHKEISPSIEQIKCIISQIVEGLHHIHSQGFMHRDIKPSNIYLMYDGTVKIGDFSIARKIHYSKDQNQEESEEKTGNVTTRFYRAPEIIYGSKHYDQSIDIWGLGCTLAELVLHQTLFPGSSDINQLELIFTVLGCPQDSWPQAANLPYYIQFDNSKPSKGLSNIIPNMPPSFVDFLSHCLTLDPSKRWTTKQFKQHPFLLQISPSSKQQLSKICAYLHEKTLKNMFIKLK